MLSNSLRTSLKIESGWYTSSLLDTRSVAHSRSAPSFLTHGYREQRRYRPISYRVAYLLLPLENVGHWVLTGELYVTVEDNALPEDSRDVHRVLLAESWNKNRSLVSNIIEYFKMKRTRILREKNKRLISFNNKYLYKFFHYNIIIINNVNAVIFNWCASECQLLSSHSCNDSWKTKCDTRFEFRVLLKISYTFSRSRKTHGSSRFLPWKENCARRVVL